ncbi:TonB-dependent receptor plug domain-containing protein [Uruburuella testudinis]|uniref:TonB-dependent receptor plug domain-containing protein n=1 Tax=Uruburuella testudinis TaxID=1282863 RepID=A0ABY4DUV5_9NEIS|nr:TonB-dependent receptor plug domain-containing protein [Uruburuella testudinis]UOO82628.1 TonB-dependent receptor plug domain-containing protein [Uruburuella testudinis]
MQPKALILALFPVFSGAYAADTADTSDNTRQVEMNALVVTATPFAQKMGTQRITQEQIQNRVTGNGTISELLKNNLNVQFSNTDGNSNTPGEIAPENVSFHGEKFYNNNWMIDGMSNNDTVNPGADKGAIATTDPDGSSPFDLPAGGTQSFWINSDIIDRVNVYDSNISAEYGQFTGGVIDAKLMDPSTEKVFGNISYRTTRSSWTKYHIDDEDFFKAESLLNQPKFTKHIYSANINQPLSERAALLFSYNRTQSTIPYHHAYLGQWENQKRQSETYLIKGLYKLADGDRLKFTAIYSPHESTYVKPSIRNSAYTNNGGGVRINGEWEHFLDNGQVYTYIGYKETHNKIKHAGSNYYNWYNPNNDFDWCSNLNCSFAAEGGYGRFETGNKTWTAKQNYLLDPLTWGNSRHTLAFGWQADKARASYRRDQNTYAYGGNNANITQDSNLVCADGDDACVDGSYYFKRRTAYYAKNIHVNNNHYAAYIQDKIDWGKWQITPGIRIDHDQFLKNTDIAPRFTASYDIFGNKNTQIFGGLNRYYSANMLAYKLREATGGQAIEVRADNNSAWEEGTETSSNARRYLHRDGLKTPYSDEINLGLQQRWGDSLWTAKWVQRHGKKQFGRNSVTVDGTAYRVLNNEGFSQSNTFTFEGELMRPWQLKYAHLRIKGGFNISRTKSNSDTYEDSLSDDVLDDKIIVNGQLRGINDRPETEYSTPWRLFADITTHFPKLNLTWTNSLNYTAGYTTWDSTSVNCATDNNPACGSYTGSATEYTKQKFANAFTLDWHFGYDLPMGRGKKLTLNADIHNVLDRVIKTKKSSSTGGNSSNVTYKLGRQYWLGARYSW